MIDHRRRPNRQLPKKNMLRLRRDYGIAHAPFERSRCKPGMPAVMNYMTRADIQCERMRLRCMKKVPRGSQDGAGAAMCNARAGKCMEPFR